MCVVLCAFVFNLMPIMCLFFCVLCGKVSVLLSAFTLLGFGCFTIWGLFSWHGKAGGLQSTRENFRNILLKKFCLLFRAWGHQRRETSKKEWKKERVPCISGNTLRESSSVKLIFVNRLGLYTNPVWSPHLSSCFTTTSYWPILLPSAPRGREMFLLTYEGSSSLPDVCC